MDKVTQQNSMGARESATASEEMTAQAEQMKMQVTNLVDLVGGKNGGGNHPLPPTQTEQTARNSLPSTHSKELSARSGMQKAIVPAHGISRGGKKIDPSEVIPFDGEGFDSF